MMLSNIVLDYVLIFGYGSIPAMGISGHFHCRSLGLFVLFIYAMRRANPERYQFWHRPIGGTCKSDSLSWVAG